MIWFSRKCYLWTRSIIEIKAIDSLLVGYPKTGSTWIRYFLYSLLRQRQDNLEQTIDAMNAAMPEFANKSFFEPWLFAETSRIIKTHQLGLPFLKNKHAALVVRDPRDIVVSYFHYASGLKSSEFSGSISDILRHPKMGVDSFFKHYESWRGSVGLVLRYEDLKDDPFLGFTQLAKFFGIERSDDEIRASIEVANFLNMQVAQEKSSNLKAEFKEGHQFVRSGKKEQWRELFSEEDIAYYESLRAMYSFDLYG